MRAPPSRHVIVVGAGPAGAVLSHLLATRGIRVTLFERQTDFAREFRGEALAPSGLEVLASLDMDAALEKVPQVVPQVLEFYANRKRVFRVEPDLADSAAQPRIVSQPALLEAIVADAEGRGDLSFERGASVKELLHEDGRVSGVRVRTAQGERRLEADLVVGCDGRSSIVRRQASFEVESEELPMDILWCKLPAPASWHGEARLQFCIGRGHLFICYISYDGLLQTAWIIPKGTYGELRERGFSEVVDDMAVHVPSDLSDHLREHRDQLVHPFLLSTAADRVCHWSVPGALVLGDAAHTMSPVGGQGINIALRDAVVAANHLASVLRAGGSSDAIDAAALRIGLERAPEVVFIQALQARPPRVIMARTWWAEVLLQLPKLLRFAPVRGLATRIARPMLFGTTDVVLRV